MATSPRGAPRPACHDPSGLRRSVGALCVGLRGRLCRERRVRFHGRSQRGRRRSPQRASGLRVAGSGAALAVAGGRPVAPRDSSRSRPAGDLRGRDGGMAGADRSRRSAHDGRGALASGHDRGVADDHQHPDPPGPGRNRLRLAHGRGPARSPGPGGAGGRSACARRAPSAPLAAPPALRPQHAPRASGSRPARPRAGRGRARTAGRPVAVRAMGASERRRFRAAVPRVGLRQELSGPRACSSRRPPERFHAGGRRRARGARSAIRAAAAGGERHHPRRGAPRRPGDAWKSRLAGPAAGSSWP